MPPLVLLVLVLVLVLPLLLLLLPLLLLLLPLLSSCAAGRHDARRGAQRGLPKEPHLGPGALAAGGGGGGGGGAAAAAADAPAPAPAPCSWFCSRSLLTEQPPGGAQIFMYFTTVSMGFCGHEWRTKVNNT